MTPRCRNKILATFLTGALTCAIAAPLPQQLIPSPLVYPLLGTRVSSSYGVRTHPVRKVLKHHSGIDLAAPRGAVIRSISAGVVVFADPHKGYGNLVVIQHASGVTSHYGHCDKISVRPGQRIESGQVIGTVGSTGMVTGPHLHFEIRRNGVALDPEQMLPNLADEAEG